MTRIVPPIPTYPIVSNDGKMRRVFMTWTQLVNAAIPLIGSGSPEGVEEADQGRLYMDEDGTTGSILYIKKDPDVMGDKSKGWVIV